MTFKRLEQLHEHGTAKEMTCVETMRSNKIDIDINIATKHIVQIITLGTN